MLTISTNFLYVRLCSLSIFKFQDTWQRHGRWMQLHHVKGIDCVDSGPCDHQQSTCFKRCLSECDRRLTLKHVASREGFDQDQTSKISRERGSASCDRDIMAHGHRMILAVDRSSPNQAAHDFRAEISYKYRCSSYVSLTLD